MPLIQCFSLRPTEKVAELSYVATLEDLGLVRATEVIVSDSSLVRQLPLFMIGVLLFILMVENIIKNILDPHFSLRVC